MAYDKADRRPNKKGRKKVCAFCVEKVEKIDYSVLESAYAAQAQAQAQ